MIISFIIYGVLFVGGIVLMGIASGLPALQGVVFTAGILCFCLALAFMMRERGGATKRSALGSESRRGVLQPPRLA